jgi:hypothetical protein
MNTSVTRQINQKVLHKFIQMELLINELFMIKCSHVSQRYKRSNTIDKKQETLAEN